ncbi:MAG: adenosylcobinamide amidohydrolase [Paracoccus sp. (in: a-proteobacteria)]|nr:adenosylcobinamide amidohydrolase [Paracoccus sp. (in: a-proteobacteria)]
MKVTLNHPWLIADLGTAHRVLSFAPHRAGFVTARRILWRQVRDADLPADLDAGEWLAAQMAAAGLADAVGMLTSRDVVRWCRAAAGPVTCVATVGLGNAERVGHRQPPRPGLGTINIAVHLADGLTDTALLEAMTIVAEARTTAVMETGLLLPQGRATGTGTDCIAVAAQTGAGRFAGLHTPLGEAIGAAVYDAVATGCATWMKEQG